MEQRHRRHPRIRSAVGLVVCQGHHREATRTKTLSLGGVSFSTRKRWQIGESIQLSLIEEGMRIETSAHVVRSDPSECAVAFDETGLRALQTLLQSVGDRDLRAAREVTSPAGALSVLFNCVDEPDRAFSRPFRRARLAELDLQGAFLKCDRPPPLGASVILVLHWDARTDTVIKVSAEVVRLHDEGFAVAVISPERERRRFCHADSSASSTGLEFPGLSVTG